MNAGARERYNAIKENGGNVLIQNVDQAQQEAETEDSPQIELPPSPKKAEKVNKMTALTRSVQFAREHPDQLDELLDGQYIPAEGEDAFRALLTKEGPFTIEDYNAVFGADEEEQ